MSDKRCPTCGRTRPKTDMQRNKFHAMCRELGLFIGLTPGKVKEAIKADFFGLDEYKINNTWYRAIKPSEQADKDEYSQLIEYTIQWAAENLDYSFNNEAA